MSERAMVVVAAGSGARFGWDKTMAELAGRPLIAHTVAAVAQSVDSCVLVCRPDQLAVLGSLDLGVSLVTGGATRTESEMAGLTALDGEPHLIGIHDGARPLISRDLIEILFSKAADVGAAIPVVEPDRLLLDRSSLRPVEEAMVAQTPQVFRGSELIRAYSLAAEEGIDAHDTAEVMQRFGDLPIAAVPGDRNNIKVTFPADLTWVAERLRGSSHSEPR